MLAKFMKFSSGYRRDAVSDQWVFEGHLDYTKKPFTDKLSASTDERQSSFYLFKHCLKCNIRFTKRLDNKQMDKD